MSVGSQVPDVSVVDGRNEAASALKFSSIPGEPITATRIRHEHDLLPAWGDQQDIDVARIRVAETMRGL